MNDSQKPDSLHSVIPFSRKDPLVSEPGIEWHQLKSEVLRAVREGAATAEDIYFDEHDRQAIIDERTFISRFGFDRPRRFREGLIRLKHAADLTDREIRLMRFTSSLRLGTHGVQLAASRGFAVFGRAAIGLLVLHMLYAWLLAAHSSEAAPILVLKLLGVAVMLAIMGSCVHQLCVRPWLIQKRAGWGGADAGPSSLFPFKK